MRLELTKRSDYAIRACLHLALGGGNGHVSSRRIAAEMDIPERFLPQVLGDLASAGILDAQIGRTGGYRLSRPATALSIHEIVEAVEGPTRSVQCVLRQRHCDATRACAFHPAWVRAQTALIDVLAGTTLADIAGAARSPGTAPVTGPSPERSLS